MAPRDFDLNCLPADWDLNDGIGWGDDAAGDRDGPAHELDCDSVRDDGERGSNGKKKRRYYSDDLKIAIYLELLAKTDPPVLRRGVSKQVAKDFGVSQRLVQNVWRNGQDYGIAGVKNKLRKNCGRKRIEIDFEAIKDVPLTERTTFQKLANALGMKRSTLHKRFKEGYLVRTPKT